MLRFTCHGVHRRAASEAHALLKETGARLEGQVTVLDDEDDDDDVLEGQVTVLDDEDDDDDVLTSL